MMQLSQLKLINTYLCKVKRPWQRETTIETQEAKVQILLACVNCCRFLRATGVMQITARWGLALYLLLKDLERLIPYSLIFV